VRPPERTRPVVAWLLALGAVGFAVRAGLALAVADRHFYGYDAQWYHLVANHLAGGDGFVVGGEVVVGGLPLTPWADPRATALFPPAYPAVLALGSLAGADTLLGHQIVSALIGATTVVLAGLLARRLAGDVAGLAAAALAALHPLLVGADVALMSESLYGLLAVALLLLAYRTIERPTSGHWVLLGTAGGVAALTRNEGIVLGAVVVAATALAVPARRDPGRLRHALLAGACLLALVVPWIVRNAVQVDGARGVSTNPGATIAGANCHDTYYGDRLGGWEYFCLRFERWHATGEPEAAFFEQLAREGLEYARDHAARVPLVVAARVGRVTSLFAPVTETRAASNEGRHFAAELTGVGAYYATLGGGIAGLVLLRARRVPVGPLLAPAAVVLAAALLHGNPRVRFALEPVLVAATGASAAAILERLLRRAGPLIGDERLVRSPPWQ
jgi:4-amino-4-deoxy-L-arabinose transferase-like glycosyltransferase